jgi:hypothetical protein
VTTGAPTQPAGALCFRGGVFGRGIVCPHVPNFQKRLSDLDCPELRMPIDRGPVAPVERFAVEFRWAAPKFLQR